MIFNLHNGQVRFSSIQQGSKPIFRPKPPMGRLMMCKLRDGSKIDYRADALGNIDVVAPLHIDTMIGLGYPIYNGDGKMKPVPLDDLVYPNNDPASGYWRMINQAKSLRSI